MKRNIKNALCIASLLLAATPINLFAQNAGDGLNIINTAVPFLTITPDARGAGYGDQGVATKADNNSQFWNPAKYVWANAKGGASYSYTPWLRNLSKGMNVNYLAGYYQIDDKQAVSASFRYFAMGEVAITDNNGSLTKNFNPNEFSVDAAYSRKLSPHLSASIGFRYISSNIAGDVEGTKAGSSFATDLGVYYQKDLGKNQMAFGASIANVGSKISYGDNAQKSYLPTNLRLGARYNFAIDENNSIAALFETTKLLVPTTNIDTNMVNTNANKSTIGGIFSSFSDAPGGFSEELKEFTYSIGTEYAYQNMVMLRGGYYHQAKMKGNNQFYTIGAGLKYKFAILDFAYLIPSSESGNNPLAHTFRFSLGLNIGTQK